MPVISSHCFANHRGGVGKTTLSYQVSAAYAAAHPECKVLVIDTTESGDLSEMLMGGLYEKRGRETLRSLIPVANVTQMFLRALVAATCTSLTDVLKAEEEKEDGSHNVLVNVVDNMPLTKEAAENSPLEKVKAMKSIEIQEFAIPLEQVNPRVPTNMYLCPSGIDLEHSIAFSDTQRQDIMAVLLDSFQNAAGIWKVFIDTDTGLHGETGAYATIGLGIADFICIPLHPDMSDWYGAQVLLNDVKMLHDLDESHAQVHLVLWNGLNVQFKQSCGINLDGKSKCFVPTRAEQDIIQTLGHLVYEEAQRLPDLFLHYNGAKTTPEEFSTNTSTCMRGFGVIGVASKDIGVPIACLKPGVFHGVHMTYNLNNDTIQHSRENLEEVVKSIDEADELKRSPNKRCKQHLEILKARRLERRLGVKQHLKQKSSTTPKKKRKAAGSSSPRDITSALYKTYALRNKYSLRNRAEKMRAKMFLDFMDTSNTSTVNTT